MQRKPENNEGTDQELVSSVPKYDPNKTLTLYKQEKKPAAVVLDALTSARKKNKPKIKVKADKIGKGIKGGPLELDVAELGRMRSAAVYGVAGILTADDFLELRKELHRDVKNKTNDMVPAIINDENLVHNKLSSFKSLRSMLENNPAIDKDMPLSVFLSMNVYLAQPTLFLYDDKYELAKNPSPIVVLSGAGVDFQNIEVVRYFYDIDKKELDETKVKNVFEMMVKNELDFIVDQKIDFVSGMPRGLVSFLEGFKMQLIQKNVPGVEIDAAVEKIKEIYWAEYCGQVNSDKYKHVKFYMNPLSNNDEVKSKLRSVGVVVHDRDVRAMALALQQKHPNAKIALQNAGDVKGLVSTHHIGMHFNTKGAESATLASLMKYGQDEQNVAMSLMRDAVEPTLANLVEVIGPENINRKDLQYGATFLSKAVIAGDMERVKYLLQVPNIDVNQIDNNRNSALGWAIAKAKPEIAILLIRANADIGVVDPHSRKQLATLITEAANANMPGWKEVKKAMDLKQATVESVAQLRSPESERPSTTRAPSAARERAKALRPSAGAATSGMFGSSTGWKAAQPKTGNDAEHSPPSPRKK